MTVRRIDSILADVAARDTSHPVRIIGVDGPSGSDKSTLARRISSLSGAPVVKIDDFVSWNDFAGWWPRFDAHVLRPLLAGKDARFQVRDWVGDEFGSALGDGKVVPAVPLVVVEGVTCTRQASDGKIAYGIWVEAPVDLRLERGLRRDGEDHRQLWSRWMRAEAEFFAADDTRARSDLRVDGAPGTDHDAEVEVVVIP